jgi:hypothetical protein
MEVDMRSRILVFLGVLAVVLIGAAPVAAATGGGSGGIAITVSPTGTVSNGTATISGTISCSPLWTSPPVQFFGDASLNQPVGRLHSVNGDTQFNLTIESCDTPVAWQATIFPFNGRFAPGTAYVQVNAFGCDQVSNCDQGSLTAVIKLKGH